MTTMVAQDPKREVGNDGDVGFLDHYGNGVEKWGAPGIRRFDRNVCL